MVRFLCVLLLAAAVRAAQVTKEAKVTKSVNLPPPNIINVQAIDPPGFILNWEQVQSPDSNDPVTGYKVKVWESHPTKIYKKVTVDGESKWIEEYVPAKFPMDSNKVPESAPVEILVGANHTTVTVEDIKLDTPYEARVLAFTRQGEGTLSRPVGLNLTK